MDTCRQCGSWSVAGHNHKKVIELGPICASLHDMDLDPFGNGLADHVRRGRSQPGCRIVGSVTIVWLTTEADDQSSLHCVIVSTDVISDHIGRRDASCGGGCSKHAQASLGDLRWSEVSCLLPLCDAEKEEQHC